MNSITLNLTDTEVAVLMAALLGVERTARRAGLGLEVTAANDLAFRLQDLRPAGNGADITVKEAGDIARGLRQVVTSQVVPAKTSADLLDRECATLKNADTRNTVEHVLKVARANADETIRVEAAAHPARWTSIFAGSVESMLSDSYNTKDKRAVKWFATRGLRA